MKLFISSDACMRADSDCHNCQNCQTSKLHHGIPAGARNVSVNINNKKLKLKNDGNNKNNKNKAKNNFDESTDWRQQSSGFRVVTR